MRGIFDGFVKWIFLLLALGAGFVFVLKTFFNPPKASVPITANPNSTQTPSPPTQVSKPFDAVKSSQSNNSAISNGNTAQSPTTNSTQEPELVRSSQSEKNDIPITKQPEEYILEIPSQLEEGAELKVFVNNDDSADPNPSNYSPSKIIKTQNIVLAPEERDDIFQESSGFFKIEEAGPYNFLIEHSNKYYFDDGRLVGKIDQSPSG